MTCDTEHAPAENSQAVYRLNGQASQKPSSERPQEAYPAGEEHFRELVPGENFLQKPFSPDQLLGTVRHCLDKKDTIEQPYAPPHF